MSLISSFKSLFATGEKAPKAPQNQASESYGDYLITPASIKEEQGFRINGTITKGEQVHIFIRADTLPSADECAKEMIRKAKQMIDQQGDRIFH
ncbi:HlyU family transcriptional regulator [Oceanospirillum linum]|uniref:Transcriptional activator HlyU n=1 Tax=Oceanospirillum linum TaxID=966 RepID=A0A1T1HAP2_OCELI|nr:HlyU family transcriptional regulator [Oceanospirillum linum]OOV86846.1 hypothetical protein BTA35_0211140 [Oceanospirillum linum]SEG20908.1 hypothetical protein SAMN04489856_106108 [Oleiphilus messinensis]SMP24793.1 hypothetical protein SAMN06264348_105107 [Oceanospirillum linum]